MLKRKKEQEKPAGPDTTFKLTVQAQDETVEQLGVYVESALPVIRIVRDSAGSVQVSFYTRKLK